MTFHVLNVSKATRRRRDRFVVVRESDAFFSGVKILVLIPDEEEHFNVESAHVRAQELNEREPMTETIKSTNGQRVAVIERERGGYHLTLTETRRFGSSVRTRTARLKREAMLIARKWTGR